MQTLVFEHDPHPIPLSSVSQNVTCQWHMSLDLSRIEAMCYGRSTIVSDVDDGGVVLNVDGGSWQKLDYVEVRTTEQRDKHTRVGRRLSARGCMRCRDSTKYAQERMYGDVAEALQSIQQGPSDTRSQSYRLLVTLSSLIY
jgi:hypothetical protein